MAKFIKKIFITRSPDDYSSSAHYPISKEEWRAFVLTQSDLKFREYLEIPQKGKPPLQFKLDVAVDWLGHPSGKPVLITYSHYFLSVTNPDKFTRKRIK